jgi:Pyruvate/2-oxoacid:ferredoxin oxidoreductase delta subunit
VTGLLYGSYKEIQMSDRNAHRKVFEVKKSLIGPAEARPRSVQPKRLSDFRGVPAAYLEVARKLSSPLLLGPPLCDELVAFVQHLFTEEEAGVVRHLGMFRGRNAEELARAEHRPLDQIEPILRRLSFEKRAIAASGPEGEKRYRLQPIMPGIFEMVLIGESPDALSPWHRRFIELFEALYETGYSLDYREGPTRMVRFLPVHQAIEAHPAALPSDKLEPLLDRFETFGIGQCQCRTSMRSLGRGCDKPVGNCTVMGQWAEQGVRDGWLRPVGRKDVLQIKREAESHGLVTWVMNVEATKGQASCSCCGCCCHAMRMVNEFNVPGLFAPPHFRPRFDGAKCSFCGKCAKNCPMGALVVDVRQKTQKYLRERCIGCGLCLLACDRQRAVAIEAVPDNQLPYRSWFSYLAHSAPSIARTAWKVWRERR